MNRSESGDQPRSVPSAEASTTRDISRSPEHVTLRRFRLVVVSGVDQGKELVSTDEKTIVGSAEGCNLQLSDPTVSRFHTEISVSSGRATIRDLGSRNGTIVEGVTVLGAVLRHGAKVVLGETTIRFEDRSDEVKVDLSEDACFGSLVGKSAAMRRVFLLLERASKSDAVVLITGETGTGKELAAESIHAASARRAGPFVTVDCSALPENLVESELFGHVRGAFTGALSERSGKFEQAHQGTLFLDEVGELSLPVQAKLLRVLQSGQLQRLGSDREHHVDVRVIAATNRDLAAEVRAGRMRADFYHRLNVYPLTVPPLRERDSDVLQLAGYFLEENRSRLRLGGLRLDAAAQAALLNRSWPGNVRELEHCISRAVLRALSRNDGSASRAGARLRIVTLGLADLWERAEAPAAAQATASMDPATAEVAPEAGLRAAVSAYERQLVSSSLARHRGSWAAAARELQLDRANLQRLAKRLEIDRP